MHLEAAFRSRSTPAGMYKGAATDLAVFGRRSLPILATPPFDALKKLVQYQLSMIFAAIHTTTATSTGILYTLAVTPESIEPPSRANP